jgi:hypothetical protein
MKHTIQEKRYRKTLDRLDFTIEDRYFCECYEMEYDHYCLRIYDLTNNREELYSVWFDGDLGFVVGNEEQYTSDDIQSIIDEAFRIIEQYIGVSYI